MNKRLRTEKSNLCCVSEKYPTDFNKVWLSKLLQSPTDWCSYPIHLSQSGLWHNAQWIDGVQKINFSRKIVKDDIVEEAVSFILHKYNITTVSRQNIDCVLSKD